MSCAVQCILPPPLFLADLLFPFALSDAFVSLFHLCRFFPSFCQFFFFLFQDENVEASVICKFCSTGTEYTTKSTACTTCTGGKYQDQNTAASVTCLTCAAGQFTTDKESPCKNCDDGKIQELAEAVEYTCKFCTAGTSFATTSKACNNCDAGKYQGACLVLFSVSSPPPYF